MNGSILKPLTKGGTAEMEGFCSRLGSWAKAGWTTVWVKEGDGFPGELHSDLPLQLSWWEDQVRRPPPTECRVVRWGVGRACRDETCWFHICWWWILLWKVFIVVAVQLLSVWLFATPWTVARQAFLSFAVSQSLLYLMSTQSMMPSNQLILCPLLLLPSIFPSIRVFSNVYTSC